MQEFCKSFKKKYEAGGEKIKHAQYLQVVTSLVNKFNLCFGFLIYSLRFLFIF